MLTIFFFDDPLTSLVLYITGINILYVQRVFLIVLYLICVKIFLIYQFIQNVNYFDLWIIVIIIYSVKLYGLYLLISPYFKTKVNLSPEDLLEEVFNNHFKNFFSREDFNVLISTAKVSEITEPRVVCSQGSPFESIIFIAKKSKFDLIAIKHNKVLISYINENSWIGVDEYLMTLNGGKLDKWLIELECTKVEDKIIIIEWDKLIIENMFVCSRDLNFKQSLLMIWYKYMAESVYKLDDHISHSLISLNKWETNVQAVPMCIYLYKLVRYLSGINDKFDESA